MDSQSSSIDFAVIGHQDSWQNITAFVNNIRGAEREELSSEKIKDIFSFIPPRDVFKINVASETGSEITGVYIETFIDPDKLGPQFTRTNINKVMNAVCYAKKMGVKIATLGGFTSIVLEGNIDSFSSSKTKFTTGNTLTAAYIVKGIEKATMQAGIELKESNVLIIGSTGDIGIAIINYLKNKVQKFILCARNDKRLKEFAQHLLEENISVCYSVCLQDVIAEADIIICVASSTGIQLNNCKKNVLICDAGYPKNLETKINNEPGIKLYHGGMGQVSNGYHFSPDYSGSFYNFPASYVSHGCILEAIVLALEKRFETYSTGKGNITIDRIEEIYDLSLKHQINIAPFYNANGLCNWAAAS